MNYEALESFCKCEPSLLILYFALSPLAELFPGLIVITRWRTSPNASDTSEIFAVILTDCWDFSRWKSHLERNTWVVWSPAEIILSFKYSYMITLTVICWKKAQGSPNFPFSSDSPHLWTESQFLLFPCFPLLCLRDEWKAMVKDLIVGSNVCRTEQNVAGEQGSMMAMRKQRSCA